MSCPGGYVIGQVANFLSVNDRKNSTKTEEKSVKKERKKQKLESLFTVKEPPDVGRNQSDKQGEGGSDKGFCPPPGIVHESLHSDKPKPQQPQTGKKRKAKDDLAEQPKRTRRDRRDKTNDDRTVFVGNLPTSVTKKDLKKLFKEFGDIETIRLRCAPRADLKIPKKLAVIKKEFHAERHNLAAFVVFKTQEDASKATKLNGKEFSEGFHMRVDLASKDKQHDHQRSVFVGNLPFDVEEEDVWKHFEDYGEVENVRLVRDRNTSIGKGFGYVLFHDKSSVSLTLKFGKHQFKGRELRIQRSTKHPDKSTPKGKSQQTEKSHQKRGQLKTGTRPKFKKPSNVTSHSFQGDKASKKASSKRLKTRKSASKGLTAVKKKKSQNFKKTQGNKSTVASNKKGFKKKSMKTGHDKKGKKKAKS